MPERLPGISFVIPVRNDPRGIDRCLRSIRAIRYPPDLIEIIVVDNGSTDDTPAVAGRHEARVLSLPGLRLGALRNAGANAADTDLVAFVDADHEIDPEWATAAAELLTDSRVGGVGAPYATPVPCTWVQRLYGRLRRHPVVTESVEWLGSGNLAIRRSAFSSVGGFDTALETCEDVDLCRKLRAQGLSLLADRRLRSIHHGDPRTLRQVFLGEMWRGRDNLRVSLRPPRSSRMLASALLPVAYLAGILGVLVGVTPAVDGWSVVGVAGILVLALILLRSILMLRHEDQTTASMVPQAMAVAAAYEFGRAFAVLGRFGYGRRRPGAVGPARVPSNLDGGLTQ